MTVIIGDATDGVRTGLAGKIANAIVALFAGTTYPAGGVGAKGVNAIAQGVVDSVTADRWDFGTQVTIGAVASVITQSALTQVSIDNLAPNPNSEVAPPSGADLTKPEWAGRTNIGASAYSGDWVRRVTGPYNISTWDMPANPGDIFYFGAQIRAVVAGANKGGNIFIRSYDKTGTQIAIAFSGNNDTTSWTLESVSLLMDAGTCRVQFGLDNAGDAAADCYYDALYARKMVLKRDMYSEAWSAPSFLNGWVNYGAPYQTASYMKDVAGYVHLRGLIRSGIINLPAFLLPVGYRPAASEIFVGLDGTPVGIRINVGSDGNVVIVNGNTAFISISGITFYAG